MERQNSVEQNRTGQDGVAGKQISSIKHYLYSRKAYSRQSNETLYVRNPFPDVS